MSQRRIEIARLGGDDHQSLVRHALHVGEPDLASATEGGFEKLARCRVVASRPRDASGVKQIERCVQLTTRSSDPPELQKHCATIDGRSVRRELTKIGEDLARESHRAGFLRIRRDTADVSHQRMRVSRFGEARQRGCDGRRCTPVELGR